MGQLAEVEPVFVDATTGQRLDDSEKYVFTAGPAATGGMLARYGTVRHGTARRGGAGRGGQPEAGQGSGKSVRRQGS